MRYGQPSSRPGTVSGWIRVTGGPAAAGAAGTVPSNGIRTEVSARATVTRGSCAGVTVMLLSLPAITRASRCPAGTVQSVVDNRKVMVYLVPGVSVRGALSEA